MRVPVVLGCVGLILPGLIAVTLGCGQTSTEWISPTATPAVPTATSLPGIVLPPWSSPTPLPTIEVTPTPNPTPMPTPTVRPAATPQPKPTSVPTATPTSAPEPDLTIGETQLEKFKRQCERSGVADNITDHTVGRTSYSRGLYGRYLLDRLSDHENTILGNMEVVGSVWETRWPGVPLESDGAYVERGSCILVSTQGKHSTWTAGKWRPEGSVTVRLDSLDGADLTEEELTFEEGYHYLSKEEGYTGLFAVRMWWTGDPEVPQVERRGVLRRFDFSSAGPGRTEQE